MAFFERADERDKQVLCNICNVKCAERSMMTHRNKCASRHTDKFSSGLLERCEFDSGHIVEANKMQLHLEFCLKRQAGLVAEFQRAVKPDEGTKSSTKGDNQSWGSLDNQASQDVDEWNREADGQEFVINFDKLKLK